jgi:SHS family lactate transporter-like MFS transporter
VFFALYPLIGWRGMFMVGALPALLVLYIRRHVQESPAFLERRHATARSGIVAIRGNVGLFVWAVVLMTAFNFFSHGTQDIYPTFLETQRGLSSHAVGGIAVVYNIGAIIRGLMFGALSQRIGRRRAILIAAFVALPIIPLWVYAATPIWLAAGAFLMQLAVQGAWGVVPVHLNELSLDAVRGTFPGFTYSSAISWPRRTPPFRQAFAIVVAVVALALALLAGFGPEAKGVRFGHGRFDGVETARVMGRLYAAARLYVNFFQPSFKLKEKRREGAVELH